MSSNLRFHVHTKHLARKANAALGPLYAVEANIPRQTLKRLYVTYVRPIFDYADVVYHGHLTVADSLNLEEIQNRAATLITGAYRRTSTNTLLNELGWTTLHVRRDINTLNMLHKIKRHAPNYLLDIIPETRESITNRNLRNSKNISIPSNRLSSFKNSSFRLPFGEGTSSQKR